MSTTEGRIAVPRLTKPLDAFRHMAVRASGQLAAREYLASVYGHPSETPANERDAQHVLAKSLAPLAEPNARSESPADVR